MKRAPTFFQQLHIIMSLNILEKFGINSLE